MSTTTSELELVKPESGEAISAGTAAANFDIIDEAAGQFRADTGGNGIISGCGLTITGGTSVTIATGVLYHKSRRKTPAETVVGSDDGLTLGTPDTYFIYYDDDSPYYATSGTASASSDVLIGWAVVSGGAVTSVTAAPALEVGAPDTVRFRMGDADSQAAADYPFVAVGTAVLSSGSVAVTLSQPFASSTAYAVTVTPLSDGTGRLYVSRDSASQFTIHSSDGGDARVVMWAAQGYVKPAEG